MPRNDGQYAERISVKDNDNLTIERPTFVTHLECAMEGDHYPADQIHNLSKAGKPLLVRYDLAGVKKALTKDALAQRPADMWRYREMLPVRKVRRHRQPRRGDDAADPPAQACEEARRRRDHRQGRGAAADRLVQGARARDGGVDGQGARHQAHGDADQRQCRRGARGLRDQSCGIKTTIFCPADTPEVNVSEIELQGATVYRVNGLIDDCGKIVGEGKAKAGWFDTSTLKEPYRIEGKKTMGLELAEQLGWDVPDVIFYPTGGGTGLIGMWKAFAELEAIGFIGTKRPRMVAVQAAGCAPMVRAFESRHRARAALGGRAHHRLRHPRAAGGRRFSDPARGAREQGICHCGDRREDFRCAERSRARGGTVAVPGGRRDLRGLQAEPRRRSG